MQIQGLQKLTLLDYPGKVACTIFTSGCNFRCPFCHNASLVTKIDANLQIPEEDVLDFLEKRKGLLDGVCISGGEPLLQMDIVSFIEKVKAMGYAVKLDTNGSFPKQLKFLVNEGLVDMVAMDIKNTKEEYASTTGCPKVDIHKIEQSVEFLKQSSIPHEFRTTVVEGFHTLEDFEGIGSWLLGESAYYLQKFVDSSDLIDSHVQGLSDEEMKMALEVVQRWIPQARLRGTE